MTEFVDFNIIGNNLVTYLFGSYTVFAIVICSLFLIILMSVGLEFKYALPLSLPVVALFTIAGWFGSGSWILSAVLLFIGLIYAFAIIRIVGR